MIHQYRREAVKAEVRRGRTVRRVRGAELERAGESVSCSSQKPESENQVKGSTALARKRGCA
jgi:hypothetical protein